MTTAKQILAKALKDECPSMEAFQVVDAMGIEGEQDWDTGETTFTFDDGSALVFGENSVKVA